MVYGASLTGPAIATWTIVFQLNGAISVSLVCFSVFKLNNVGRSAIACLDWLRMYKNVHGKLIVVSVAEL